MLTCPVCDHPQATGEVCENCGKVLAPSWPGEVEVTRMAELSPTGFEAEGEVAVTFMPEVESTHTEAVGVVASEAVPDFDRGRALENTDRTPVLTGPLVCRYCRQQVQTGAVFCEGCGMRQPPTGSGATVNAPGPKRREAVWTRCRACGARVRSGLPCTDCGTQVPEVVE